MRLIDVDDYCKNRCMCNREHCDKEKCSIYLAPPTIDPASLRPKGEWIMKETMIRSPFAKNVYCSECLEEASFAHNFCPNCGADMRGNPNDS